jgi:hypothetical protein
MNGDAVRKSLTVLGPGPDCLAIDDLVQSLEGGQGDIQKENAAKHVSTCAYCKAELAMFQTFADGNVRSEERRDVEAIVSKLRRNSPVPSESWWTRLLQIRIWAPAGVAFASIVLVVVLWGPGRPGGPEVSGPGDVMRSHAVTLIAPLGDLPEAPEQLRWNGVSGATGYRVRLSEVDHTELWSGATAGTEIALPDDIRRKITPLKTLDWQVLAVDDRSSTLADSGLRQFRVVAAK